MRDIMYIFAFSSWSFSAKVHWDMSGKVMFVCRRFILTAWLLSLVPSVPNLFIFTTEYSKQGNEECVSDFSAWNTTLKKGYFSLVFLVIFVIPLVNMITDRIEAVKVYAAKYEKYCIYCIEHRNLEWINIFLTQSNQMFYLPLLDHHAHPLLSHTLPT